MINNNFALICNRTSVDQNSKSISVFDVLEHITVFTDSETNVRIPMHFEILSHWMRKQLEIPTKSVARLSLQGPNKKKNKNVEINIDLTESIFLRSIIQVSGIELSGPGLYHFIFDLQQQDGKWKKVAEIPFVISYEKPSKSIIEKVPPK